jgi:hypothetical protein
MTLQLKHILLFADNRKEANAVISTEMHWISSIMF